MEQKYYDLYCEQQAGKLRSIISTFLYGTRHDFKMASQHAILKVDATPEGHPINYGVVRLMFGANLQSRIGEQILGVNTTVERAMGAAKVLVDNGARNSHVDIAVGLNDRWRETPVTVFGNFPKSGIGYQESRRIMDLAAGAKPLETGKVIITALGVVIKQELFD